MTQEVIKKPIGRQSNRREPAVVATELDEAGRALICARAAEGMPAACAGGHSASPARGDFMHGGGVDGDTQTGLPRLSITKWEMVRFHPAMRPIGTSK